MLNVRELPFTELEANLGFKELVAEYIAETSNPAVPNAQPMIERYRLMNELGTLRAIGAFDGDIVVGLCGVLVAQSQHHPFPICSMESFFLRKAWRKGSNGLRLLNKAKEITKDVGAPGLAIMTPPQGNYNELCKTLGMVHTHNAWWCAL